MPDDKRVDRRRFFRSALGELFKPLERKAAPIRRAIEEFNKVERYARPAAQPGPAPGEPPLVRPPAGRTSARGAPGASASPGDAPDSDKTNRDKTVSDKTGGDSSEGGKTEGDEAGGDEAGGQPSDGPDSDPAEPSARLRPPGALPEGQFANVCSRCGECARVCPAHCIRLEPDGRGDGLPFIDVAIMPCVLCDGLLCMHSCPTTALRPTALADIDMGTARWHEDTCVRSRREECTTCIDQCPVGATAIELLDGRVHVHEDGCVGCGVCEHYCPTTPKSITVTPRTL